MSETTRRWAVTIGHRADKALRKAPADLRRRLREAIDGLSVDPRPHGCKRLAGLDFYRIRVGEWRVVYRVRELELEVLVIEIAPRSGVYDNL